MSVQYKVVICRQRTSDVVGFVDILFSVKYGYEKLKGHYVEHHDLKPHVNSRNLAPPNMIFLSFPSFRN